MLRLLIIISFLLPQTPFLAGDSAVRITVLGVDDQPVAGLTLTLRDEAQTLTVQTDSTGSARAGGLAGNFLRVLDAVSPDGTRLQLDPTTVNEGLRFGLLPGEERQVILRRDAKLLFLDPETIFAGTAPDAVTPTAQVGPAANSQPITSREAPELAVAPGARLFGLVILGSFALAAFGAIAWWLLRVRAHRRRSR